MRFLKWIRVFLQGGRCYKCKYYYKPYRVYDAGYCARWKTKYRLDCNLCADFEEWRRNEETES